MSKQFQLQVYERESTGKRGNRQLRQQDRIPAVFYTHGKKNHNLYVEKKALLEALHAGGHIFEITLDGKTRHTFVKEVQYHPVTDELLHVDFQGVTLTEKIHITVPLVLKGEAPGVKAGGVLMQNLNHLEVYCLPTTVPDNIEVDISRLELNHGIAVEDLTVPEGVEIDTPPETSLVLIQPSRVQVEAEVVVEVEEERVAEAAEAEEPEASGESPAED